MRSFENPKKLGRLSHFIKREIEKNLPGKTIDGIHSGLDKQKIYAKKTQTLEKNREEATKQEKARIIQTSWCFSKIADHLFSDESYKAYISMLNSETHENVLYLAELMFGRTIANNTRDDFPNNPFKDPNATYSREDEIKPDLKKIIIESYNIDPRFIYNCIFIISTKNTPINEMINLFFPNGKKGITVFEKSNEKLIVLQIASSIFDIVKFRCQVLGLIASPLEIAQYVVRNKKLFPIVDILLSTSQDYLPKYIKPLKSLFPKNIDELKNCDLVKKISKIGLDNNNPNQILANCLERLIKHLPETNAYSIIERIYIFLYLAANFYQQNYNRFAFCLYAIFHETSLIFYHEMNSNHLNLIDFDEYKHSVLKRFIISCFGKEANQSSNLLSLVCPALSGTNAFAIATTLINSSMKYHPKITVVGHLYYEFEILVNPLLIDDSKEEPNIYLISTGPIATINGISPGVDINQLIRNRILKHKDISRNPVLIVIDATSALNESFKIDDELIKYIHQGNISLLIFESDQKFGELHTDYIQSGKLYGILSKKLFDENSINSFETRARHDLTSHLDMLMGAYISITCADFLEPLKKLSFSAGDAYRKAFEVIFDISSPIQSFPEMLDIENNLYFTCFPFQDRKSLLYLEVLNDRDSFGFSHTTISKILSGKITALRISPGALSKINFLIEIGTLYLLKNFSQQESCILLSKMCKEIINDDKKLNFPQQLFFMSMLSNQLVLANNYWIDVIFILYFAYKLIDKQLNLFSEIASADKLQQIRKFCYNLNINLPGFEKVFKCLRYLFIDKDPRKIRLMLSMLKLAEYGFLSRELTRTINIKWDEIHLLEMTTLFDDHVLFFMINKNQISDYIQKLNRKEKFNFYQLLSKHKDHPLLQNRANQSLLLIDVAREILAILHSELLNQFVSTYKKTAKFIPFFRSPSSHYSGCEILNKEFKSKIFNNEIKSFEEVVDVVKQNPDDFSQKIFKQFL